MTAAFVSICDLYHGQNDQHLPTNQKSECRGAAVKPRLASTSVCEKTVQEHTGTKLHVLSDELDRIFILHPTLNESQSYQHWSPAEKTRKKKLVKDGDTQPSHKQMALCVCARGIKWERTSHSHTRIHFIYNKTNRVSKRSWATQTAPKHLTKYILRNTESIRLILNTHMESFSRNYFASKNKIRF